jgi:hypothetical protein
MATNYTLAQLRTNPNVIAALKPLQITLKQKPPIFQKTLTTFNGGTGVTSFDDGDLLIGNAPTLTVLPIGNVNQVLTISKVGGLDWTDNLNNAQQNLVNYDLLNKYSYFQNQAQLLTQDYAAKGTAILQVEEDTGYVGKNTDAATKTITSNEAQLTNSNKIINSLQTTTNNAQNTISSIYSNLVTLDNTVSSLDGALDTQLTATQNLFTGLNTLRTMIGNIYSGISSDISFKNLIINGDFQVWQRSTYFSGINTNVAYVTADRWYHSRDTNGTLTSQKSNSLVNNIQTNTLLLSLHGATTGLSLMTTVENAMVLQNTFATLSFYVRCSTVQTLTITVIQNFGNGGSTPITLMTGSCVTTGSWVRWSNTFDVPDISNNFIGPNSYIQIIILTQPEFTNLELAFVQLEENVSATNITSRQYQIEELLCKRYYEEGYSVFAGRATASLGVSITHSYSSTKYRTPTLTASVVTADGFTNAATVGFMNELNNGSVKVTKNNISGYGSVTIKYQADAEIL